MPRKFRDFKKILTDFPVGKKKSSPENFQKSRLFYVNLLRISMKKRPPFYTPNWKAIFCQITVALEEPGIILIWWTRTRRGHHALY